MSMSTAANKMITHAVTSHAVIHTFGTKTLAHIAEPTQAQRCLAKGSAVLGELCNCHCFEESNTTVTG